MSFPHRSTFRGIRCLHSLISLTAFAVVLCTTSLKARATSVIPPSFDELVNEAQTIFNGEVASIRSEWAGVAPQQHIVSFVTFNVAEVIKGTAASPYVLKVNGGTVGTTTMELSDAPKFNVGDRMILFVENNGTQLMPLVGFMHGFFRVQKDPWSGEDIVIKHNGKALKQVDEIGVDAHAAGLQPARMTAKAAGASASPGASPLKKHEFTEQIRRKVQGGSR